MKNLLLITMLTSLLGCMSDTDRAIWNDPYSLNPKVPPKDCPKDAKVSEMGEGKTCKRDGKEYYIESKKQK